MATVTVYRVTQGWPQGDSEEGEPGITTIDLEVSGKYLRWGKHEDAITSASSVQAAIEADVAEVLDLGNNGSKDTEFPLPSGGTLRADWIPAPFDIT